MTPRELDAQLAERLFGRKVEAVEPGAPYAGILSVIGEPPRYSTTWEGAGLVVAKMGERGHRLVLRVTPHGTDRAQADFSPSALGGVIFRESAPEAVALAALRALGVEVS